MEVVVDTYRRVWLAGAAALVAVGVLFAVFTLPLRGLVAIPVFSALLGCAVCLVRDGKSEIAGSGRSGRLTRRYVPPALTGAAIGLGTAGWVGTIGPAWLGMAALLAASAPPAVSWIRQALAAAGATTPPRGRAQECPDEREWTPPATVTLPLQDLTLSQVVSTWRSSYTALQHTRTAEELASITEIRARCLDELQRRRPEGFATWMAAGARAASDPTRYMNPMRNTASDE